MTPDLAKIHFPYDEDREDQYQEKLFKTKQFYFQKTPVPKLNDQKVKELRDIHRAYVIRFGVLDLTNDELEIPTFQFNANLFSDYSTLQDIRAWFRGQMARTSHALQFATLLENWLEVEFQYAKVYSAIFQNDDLSLVNVSNQADPMLLIQELRSMDKVGGLEFSNFSAPIIDELKRCAKFVFLQNAK